MMLGFIGQVAFGDGVAAPKAPAGGVALWAGQVSLWAPDENWHGCQVRCFEQSDVKLAIFGTCLSSEPAVRAVLARCQVDGDYARLAALPGSSLLSSTAATGFICSLTLSVSVRCTTVGMVR